VVNGVPILIPPGSRHFKVKQAIQQFWGELYRATYWDNPEEHTPEEFIGLLDSLEEMFRHRRHLAVVEMPIHELSGLQVLEVGSGSGAHSALFAERGATVTSVDITPARVLATARKLDWVSTEGHMALQADAERLPFRDCRFDIIYSNGVLHHTPDTARAIDEVYRVLRPGGRAVIMLYARHSFRYWIDLFLIRGVLRGQLVRSGNWLGRATEWMSRKPQRVFNPETKVFSGAQVRRLFRRFAAVHLRKNSFDFDMALGLLSYIPRAGPSLRMRILRRLEERQGVNRAGILVYGAPWRNETPLELALGRWIGFGLNILAVK
jgi:ubiquinone/menaquinone biosynthesis C-methylase UbiE